MTDYTFDARYTDELGREWKLTYSPDAPERQRWSAELEAKGSLPYVFAPTFYETVKRIRCGVYEATRAVPDDITLGDIVQALEAALERTPARITSPLVESAKHVLRIPSDGTAAHFGRLLARDILEAAGEETPNP